MKSSSLWPNDGFTHFSVPLEGELRSAQRPLVAAERAARRSDCSLRDRVDQRLEHAWKKFETRTHPLLALGSMVILGLAAVAIVIYQWQTNRRALAVTAGLYVIAFSAASVFSGRKT